jgi:hypothetical protein
MFQALWPFECNLNIITNEKSTMKNQSQFAKSTYQYIYFDT